MKRFTLGFFLVFVTMFVAHQVDVARNINSVFPIQLVNSGYYDDPVWYQSAIYYLDIARLALLPSLVAMGTALLLDYRRPKKLFDRAARQRFKPILGGIVCAVAALTLALVPITFAPEWGVPDELVLSVCAALATMLLMPLCKGVGAGVCLRCGFDLRASLDSGRCPECGTGMAQAVG